MINQAIKRFSVRITEGKKEYIQLSDEKTKEFENDLQDGDEFVRILQKGQKLKTLKQYRYLHGGVLKPFVPNNFDSIDDAKDYFCYKHLTRTDLFAPEDIEDMTKALNMARRIHSIERLDNDVLAIKWTKSTKFLSTKGLTEFIDLVVIEAAELDIIIQTPKEYYESQF